MTQGYVDTIVVAHLDRLYRSPRELEDLIDLVEKTGLTIVSVHGGDYDLATSDGRAFARVVTSFAKKESEDKARRVTRRRLSDAKEGKPSPGGLRPLGYTADGLHLHPVEAPIVRSVVEYLLDGGTLHGATRLVADAGLTASSGRPIARATLRRTLSSHRLVGRRVYRGEVVATDCWPAIVTPEEHDRLVAILRDPTRQQPANSAARRHVLSGFVYCAPCDRRMEAATNKRRPIYRCLGCGASIVTAPLVEFVVTSVLLWISESAYAEGADDTTVDVTPIRAEIAALEARIERANEAYLAGAFSADELARAKATTSAALSDAYDRLGAASGRRALSSLPRTFDELVARWGGANLTQRRDILDAAITRVEISRARPDLKGLDRAAIVYRA